MIYAAVWATLIVVSLWWSQAGVSALDWAALPALAGIITILAGPITAWLRSRRQTFDPVVLVSIFGLHFFVFGPVYQYSSRYFPYLRWTDAYDAWVVPWFWMQFIFLAVAFGTAGLFYRLPPASDAGRPDMPPGTKRLLFRALLVTLAVKILTLAMFGGFSGVAAAYSQRVAVGGLEYNPFAGIGTIVLVGDMFPVALGLYLIARFRDAKFFLSGGGLAAFTLLIAAVSMLFVGLQGSRSSVVFAIVLVLLSYHFLARNLRKRHLFMGALGLVAFMQVYLAYKFGGLDAVLDSTAREAAFAERQLTDEGSFVWIRDFTRMDTQVIALHSVLGEGFSLSWGRSLLSGITSILPSALVPWRDTTFILEKTQIISPGRSFTQAEATTLVFGMFGELLVNFGAAVMLFAPLYGWLLALAKRVHFAARNSFSAALMAPAVALLPIALLVYDSNSLMFFLIQSCLLPGVMAWLVARKAKHLRRRQAQPSHQLAQVSSEAA